MEVEDAEVVAVGADDDELGDAVVAHEVEGVDGIVGVENAFGVGAHDVGGHHRCGTIPGREACETEIKSVDLLAVAHNNGIGRQSGQHDPQGQ